MTTVSVVIDEKQCTRCGQVKRLTAFYARKEKRDGRHSWCSQCVRDRTAERWREHHAAPEAVSDRPCFRCKQRKPIAEFSGWRWECKTCAAAHQRELRAADPLLGVRSSLKARYKLTLERYEEMLAEQGGVCAICLRPPGRVRLAVDHDHSCCPGALTCGNCIRGLVCYPCNGKIGVLESNTDYAKRLRAYARVEVRRIE